MVLILKSRMVLPVVTDNLAAAWTDGCAGAGPKLHLVSPARVNVASKPGLLMVASGSYAFSYLNRWSKIGATTILGLFALESHLQMRKNN